MSAGRGRQRSPAPYSRDPLALWRTRTRSTMRPRVPATIPPSTGPRFLSRPPARPRDGESPGTELAQIQRKSRFHHRTARTEGQSRVPFQMLTTQIRYSSDQPNFSRDQRIEAAVTTEKQRKSHRAEIRRNRREG